MLGFKRIIEMRDDTKDNEIIHVQLGSFSKFVSSVLLLVLFFLLIYCIWTLNRGFDITDESYSLLLAMYPQTFKTFISAAHWITSPLWSIIGNLIAFRTLGIAILLISAAILGFGVICSASLYNIIILPGWFSRIAIIAATEIASLHFCCYGCSVFFTPTYNLISISGSYCAFGFTLLAFGRKQSVSIYALHLLAGICIGIVFLCKFPAGITIMGLCIFITLVLNSNHRVHFVGIAISLVAMAATVLLVTRSQMSLNEAWEQFKLGIHFYRVALPEPISAKLFRNLHELMLHFKFVIRQFFVPLCCFFFYFFTRRTFFLFLGIFSLILILIFSGYFRGGFPQVTMQISALVGLVMLFVVLTFPIWRNSKSALFLAALIALPYCFALGTNNQFPLQIIVSLAPWGALSALLSFNQSLDVFTRSATLVLCVIFAMAVALPIMDSRYHPAYNNKQSLKKQSELVRVGEIGMVHVDKNMHSFIQSLNAAVMKCKITPGTPFIGLYDIPGIAIIIKAVPILTPWLINNKQAQSWLINAPDSIIRSAVIGIKLSPDGKMPSLPEVISNFPSGYTLCGGGTYPYEELKIQLWAPKVL